jgi:hypothetical protein
MNTGKILFFSSLEVLEKSFRTFGASIAMYEYDDWPGKSDGGSAYSPARQL